MSRDKEYLEHLIKTLESDKTQMMLFVGFELAVPLLTIKDLSFGKNFIDGASTFNDIQKGALVVSIALFLLAALMHFLYMRRVHANIFAVARILLEGSGQEARSLLFDENTGLWAKHGWKYNLGMAALVGACVCYAFIVLTVVFP